MIEPDNEREEFHSELNNTHPQTLRPEQDLEEERKVALAAKVFQEDITVHTLLESLAEAVIISDTQGTIIFINRRAKEMFGYDLVEITGHSLNILVPKQQVKSHKQHIKDFFKDPHIRPMGQNIDLAGRHKNGAEFPVEVSLSYLDTEVGRIGLAFVTDITPRKQAEWALKLRNEELRKANQELKEEIARRERAEQEIKVMSGLIPICASCKKIRNDEGFWQQIEIYIKDHSEAEFSHGICPECKVKLYPELFGDEDK